MSSNEHVPGGLRGMGLLRADTVDKVHIAECRTCGQMVELTTDGIRGELVGIDDDGHIHPCREV